LEVKEGRGLLFSREYGTITFHTVDRDIYAGKIILFRLLNFRVV
jgi:hypothetical protein